MRGEFRWIGLVVLLLAPLFVLEDWERNYLPYLISSSILLAILFVFMKEMNQERFNLFQPVLWVGLIFFLPNFVLKGWYLTFIEPENYFTKKLLNRDYNLNLALATGLLSYLCLAAGYYLFPCRRPAVKLLEKQKSAVYHYFFFKWPSFLLYLTGAVFSGYLLLTGGGGYTALRESTPFLHVAQHIAKFNLYGLFLFLFCFLSLKRDSGLSWKIMIGIIVVGQVGLALFSGSRAGLLMNCIILLAVMQYTGLLRRSSTKFIGVLALSAILLAVSFTFVTQFRSLKYSLVGHERPASTKDMMEISRVIVKRQTQENVEDTGAVYGNLLIERVNNLESLALVLERASQVQHLERAYGIENDMVHELIWGLVPRFMYPDKPMMSDFAVSFGIIYHDQVERSLSMANPTVIGDLYRNCGYLGMAIGMFILGLFLRGFYEITMGQNKNPFFIIVYFFSVFTINYEATYIGIFHGFLRLWIMLGLFSACALWLYRLSVGNLLRFETRRI